MTRVLPTCVGRVALIAVTATSAACTETPTSTRLSARTLAPRLDITSGSRTPKRYPNSVKYRDAGLKPATGRSGSATLTARALVGRNQRTTLELTTGSLESAQAATGNLEKVQIKVFDPQGREISTTNDKRGPGGNATYDFTSLVRGAGLQVQANITGIDASRTDVVTVQETVKLRPDIAPRYIAAPPRVVAGAPVQILATVREMNGDVGARADCVLSVDGQQAAIANRIWVDAGDAVSCAFEVWFWTTGTRRLEVALLNVSPGDYDESNNTLTGTIDVGNPGFVFNAHARDVSESFRYHSVWTIVDGPDALGTTRTFTLTTDADQVGNHQIGEMFGNFSRRFESNIITDFEVMHSTSGNVLLSKKIDLELTPIPSNSISEIACGNFIEFIENNMGSVQISACSGVSRFELEGTLIETPFSFFSVFRNTSELTYVAGTVGSNIREDFSDGTTRDTWFPNFEFLFEQPSVVPRFGADYTISVSFVSGSERFTQTAFMPLTAYEGPLPNREETCSDWWIQSPTHRERTCLGFTNWYIKAREGSMTGIGFVDRIGEPAP